MEEDNEESNFEAITLSNVWIKEHILDIIKNINLNEIIAESGGEDIFALSQMELIDKLNMRIEGLGLMKAYILQLKDNIDQYISKRNLIKAEVLLTNIDNHNPLLMNDENYVSHSDNFYLSSDFYTKLKRLRSAKTILIRACGEAELLMPKRNNELIKKKVEVEDE